MTGGGGGSGPSEPGFLNLPTFTLAAVLAFFLIVSTAFERGTHHLILYLKRRKRNGLAQAVSNLVMELTLVGLVSLLLIALQGPICSICVSYSPGIYEEWSLISNVAGCDCCLASTATTSTCFKASRDCGPDACNCEGHDPQCLVSQDSLATILGEFRADAACFLSNCTGEYLERAAGSEEAAVALEAITPQCDGPVALDTNKCGPGKSQLVTNSALHELHIFIFVTAVSHVLMGVIMVLLASWQLHMWKKECAGEDEHAKAVRTLLDSKSGDAQSPHARGPSRMRRMLTSWRHTKARGLPRGNQPQAPSASTLSAPSPKASSAGEGSHGGQPVDALSIRVDDVAGEQQTPPLSSPKTAQPGSVHGSGQPGAPGPQANAPRPGAGIGSGGAQAVSRMNSKRVHGMALLQAAASAKMDPTQLLLPEQAQQAQHAGPGAAAAAGGPRSQAAQQQQQQQQVDVEAQQHRRPLPSSNGASEDLGPSLLAPVASLQLEGRMLPDVVTLGDRPPLEAGRKPGGRPPQIKRLLGRSVSIKQDDYVAWGWEYLSCLLHLLLPRPISTEDVRLMRASFMLTHRVPAGFDFWRYVSDSMEDDFAHIVGISLEMWLTMIVFVLVSGPLGWATTLFLSLAALFLVAINVKLVQIIRHACRGARANQLSSNIFWFGKPPLMLHPIKYTLFLCSFTMGAALFFLWSFGAKSCPFTAGTPSSNPFYFAQVVPWWAMLLFAVLVFLDASFRTLPLYTLAVQMGSDFKQHMLPRGIREKLLLAAERIKQKHKEQQRLAASNT